MLRDEAMAQSGCRSALMSLSPCLGYVGGNSSTPTYSCCSQLANVVRSQSRCLCILVSSHGSPTGLKINETLALELPDACNVQTPPISRCDDKSIQFILLIENDKDQEAYPVRDKTMTENLT
ncbi:hypothetical protein OSB04_023109 [Centaurea solstitialis]|uniref:Bifunctional inhibitor/plant lipid transfer protein/seed storage helical domain-containing protein n=1 Tax=Centaurea solstitialis TaxID=347529 RepID=A0AA38T209_9ASTR|nr:hypothetical protein OSB04_023109 [Centaurea solstitialis]